MKRHTTSCGHWSQVHTPVKELFKFIIGKKEGKISDRVYDADGKVYVHLPFLFYLKRLFRKRFSILLIASSKQIKLNEKPNQFSAFFGELLILVGVKN